MHALYAIFGALNMETPAEVSRNLCARLCEHRYVWDTDFDIGFQSHRAQKRWTTVNAKEGAEACVEEGPDRLHKCPGLQLNYSETCYQLHDCEGRRRLLSNTMLGATFTFWIIAPLWLLLRIKGERVFVQAFTVTARGKTCIYKTIALMSMRSMVKGHG